MNDLTKLRLRASRAILSKIHTDQCDFDEQRLLLDQLKSYTSYYCNAFTHMPEIVPAVCRHLRWRVNDYLQGLASMFALLQPHQTVASFNIIYEELQGLEACLDNVTYFPCVDDDNTNKRPIVTATTREIELEDMEFGKFRLELWAPDQHRGKPLRIRAVALTPNFCDNGKGSICHPHIHDEEVCLGDGTSTVMSAIRNGFINDAFTAVTAVLNTYVPDAAYRKIECWDSPPCTHCGNPSETSCDNCGDSLCYECTDCTEYNTYCQYCAPCDNNDDDDDDSEEETDEESVVLAAPTLGYFNPDIPADILAEMRSPVVSGPPGFLAPTEEEESHELATV